MKYIFNNEVPIYLQIVDIITKEIVSGILVPGQKIPSVREYSSIFAANPNTISKALQILEDMKLIYTERTNGKYVTLNNEIIIKCKEEIFSKRVMDFIDDMNSIGYNKEDIIKKIMES